eukprot:CAMPEP_0184504684 /NCGR_PEP_ID=MMETSP0113_2-20130426/52593_1 /TAXON_ID=91329 /ORGANISM="Norrisiella sphaerica, Strain BC52" /LENGTH=66 /DNA_ID=CAMNT_0026894339 /DNA_START=678 /DNA_END=878 /DNA_ORIENTATION=-
MPFIHLDFCAASVHEIKNVFCGEAILKRNGWLTPFITFGDMTSTIRARDKCKTWWTVKDLGDFFLA